jgi:hypothetical protein
MDTGAKSTSRPRHTQPSPDRVRRRRDSLRADSSRSSFASGCRRTTTIVERERDGLIHPHLPAPPRGSRELLFIKPFPKFGEGTIMQRLLLRLKWRTDLSENRLGGTEQHRRCRPLTSLKPKRRQALEAIRDLDLVVEGSREEEALGEVLPCSFAVAERELD